MSILSALKAKGAKGNNIEEAVKTLPTGGQSGYEVSENTTIIFNGDVETFGEHDFWSDGVKTTPYILDYDEVDVIFNNIKYHVAKVDDDGILVYGSNGDFTDYPFRIEVEQNQDDAETIYEDQFYLNTPEQGTYTLTIMYTDKTISVSDDFVQAVNMSVSNSIFINIINDESYTNPVTDKTAGEILEYLKSGVSIIIKCWTGDSVVNYWVISWFAISYIDAASETISQFTLYGQSGEAFNSFYKDGTNECDLNKPLERFMD